MCIHVGEGVFEDVKGFRAGLKADYDKNRYIVGVCVDLRSLVLIVFLILLTAEATNIT